MVGPISSALLVGVVGGSAKAQPRTHRVYQELGVQKGIAGKEEECPCLHGKPLLESPDRGLKLEVVSLLSRQGRNVLLEKHVGDPFAPDPGFDQIGARVHPVNVDRRRGPFLLDRHARKDSRIPAPEQPILAERDFRVKIRFDAFPFDGEA